MGEIEFFDDRLSLFDEGAMNQTLSNDGLSQYFANSFLVEIQSGDFHYPTDDIDFVKLHSDRKRNSRYTQPSGPTAPFQNLQYPQKQMNISRRCLMRKTMSWAESNVWMLK